MTVPAPPPSGRLAVDRIGDTGPWSAAGLSTAGLAAPAAAVAAGVLALTSTGSVVVAAVLVGVACRSVWTGAASVLATASVAVRFSTTSFDDLAGLQSVLGPAGTVGPPLAAASAWVAATAIVVAVGPLGSSAGPARLRPLSVSALPALLPVVPAGALAAALVAGPGPGGSLLARGSWPPWSRSSSRRQSPS